MRLTTDRIVSVLLVSASILIFFTLIRVATLLFFGSEYISDNALDEVLVYGLRVDLSIVGYITLAGVLLALFTEWVFFYYKIVFALIVLLTFADFGFYMFFGTHTDIRAFGIIHDDTDAILKTAFKDYSYLIFAFLGFTYISYLIVDRLQQIRIELPKKAIIVIFLLLPISIRGSFGTFPVGHIMPDFSSHQFLNELAKNGVREIVRTLKTYAAPVDFQAKIPLDLERALAIHGPLWKKTDRITEHYPNIVFIMVESFGLPVIKYQSDTFDILGSLKLYFDMNRTFRNFVSSGNGTIESLEATILGLPVRPKSAPLAESGYKPYPWAPIQQLKRRGYKTIFLYGGDLSWRNVGQFAKAQGFDEVYGKASFETNSSSFHTWGVFDEVVYKYAEEILKKNRNERVFLFILTTNNHPPYELPDWYSAPVMVIPEEMKIKGDKHLAQKRFQSFRYAMDSLGKFLKRVQNEKNMVVVTADNNTIEGIVEFGSLLESKNIPLYIYTPFKSKLCIDAYGSHKDIFPTIFHLLFSEMEYFSVGENICDLGIGFNGDSIVFSSDGVKKVDLFSKDGDDLDWYYRSSIYITDYLIRNGEL